MLPATQTHFTMIKPSPAPDLRLLGEEDCRRALLTQIGGRLPCRKFMHQTVITPHAHNIVSTVHLSTDVTKINLECIAQCMPNSVYDKKRFAAITLRISNPKITALLFSSGKLVVTGSLSRQMAKRAVHNIVRMLRETRLFRFVRHNLHTIQNIVCNVRLPKTVQIDLNALYQGHNTLCTYQPSIFPGLILRPRDSPVVLLIFKSSRIVVTGAHTYHDVCHGFELTLEVLAPYLGPNFTVHIDTVEPPRADAIQDTHSPSITMTDAGTNAPQKNLSSTNPPKHEQQPIQ